MKTLAHGDRPNWLAYKHPRIGSSDAAAILGCGYANECASTVYARMVHGVQKQFDQATIELMQQGSILEHGVIELFAARNPEWKVTHGEKFATVCHPDYPHLVSSLDAHARRADEMAAVEAKVVRWSDEWNNNGLPLKYLVQVTHQMICTGWKTGVVIALVGGQYQQRWVERDEALVEQMLIAYDNFMHCVRTKTPPNDASPVAYQSVQAQADKELAKYAGSELSKAVREVVRLQEQADRITRDLNRGKQVVQQGAAGAGWVVLDDQSVVRLGKSKIEVRKALPKGVKVTK